MDEFSGLVQQGESLMTTTCYVPVIGYVPGLYPNQQLGYEIWVSNPQRAVPYIFKTTLQEYGRQMPGSLLGQKCMIYGLYLHVSPLALYATKEHALFALGMCIPTKTQHDLDATR